MSEHPAAEQVDPMRLKDCVVAVVPPGGNERALGALPADAEPTLLARPEDLTRFGRGGLVGALDRLAAALGDESRVIEEMEEALGDGAVVVIVPTGTRDESVAIADRLREVGAGPIWQYGEWTFTRSGTPSPEEQ
jgi:hypothetical protein